MDNRNYLAQLRTQMANERTLMSYYRSALALIGLSAFIFKFYDAPVFRIVSGISVLAGIVLAIYGTVRYRRFNGKMIEEKQ